MTLGSGRVEIWRRERVSSNDTSLNSMTRYRERRWWRWVMVMAPRREAAEMYKYKYLSIVIYSVYVVWKCYSRK